MSVIHCSPHSAHILLKPDAQFHHLAQPVKHARFDANGDAALSAISYEDCNRMHPETHSLARGRRLSAPPWSLSPEKLKMLLVVFWERRGGTKLQMLPNGDARARLAAAQRKLESEIPDLLSTLRRLCYQYVKCEEPQRKIALQRQISNLDTRICMIRRGPGVIVRIVHDYWSLGQSSADVGRALGLKPVSIRQILHRLALTWKKLQVSSESELS